MISVLVGFVCSSFYKFELCREPHSGLSAFGSGPVA